MEYFKKYTSNSVAGSGNQSWFSAPEVQTGRVFYKILKGGKFSYSLLFSNVMDSTFADGGFSHKNLICSSWRIYSARVGRCSADAIGLDFAEPEAAARVNASADGFCPLLFSGAEEKTVAPGEFFASDPVTLTFNSGDYLCLEMTVSGPMIPYHEESLLPAYRKTDSGWVYERKTPFAGMIGCDRPVDARIGYLGDSITQGIGAAKNSYLHWNALLSEHLGDGCACWNLGLGYGRADDMASDGAWLYKAKQNDFVILCAGVNDLNRGFMAEQIIANLCGIVEKLTAENIRILIQTVPPFNYDPLRKDRWQRVNAFIRQTLSQKVFAVFDTVPILGMSDAPERAKYGGHPNEEGSALWAEALYEAVRETGFLEGKKND